MNMIKGDLPLKRYLRIKFHATANNVEHKEKQLFATNFFYSPQIMSDFGNLQMYIRFTCISINAFDNTKMVDRPPSGLDILKSSIQRHHAGMSDLFNWYELLKISKAVYWCILACI